MYEDCAGLGYLLLGDAAGVLDPLSSRGVLRALMSGMLCGHLIGAHRANRLSDAGVVRHYTSWLSAQLESDIAGLNALYRRHPSKELAHMFAPALAV